MPLATCITVLLVTEPNTRALCLVRSPLVPYSPSRVAACHTRAWKYIPYMYFCADRTGSNADPSHGDACHSCGTGGCGSNGWIFAFADLAQYCTVSHSFPELSLLTGCAARRSPWAQGLGKGIGQGLGLFLGSIRKPLCGVSTGLSSRRPRHLAGTDLIPGPCQRTIYGSIVHRLLALSRAGYVSGWSAMQNRAVG